MAVILLSLPFYRTCRRTSPLLPPPTHTCPSLPTRSTTYQTTEQRQIHLHIEMPFPVAFPPFAPTQSPKIVLLTLDCLPPMAHSRDLPYPVYSLSTEGDAMDYLVDNLRLPASSSLPCAALLTPWGLEVLMVSKDKVVGLGDLSSHAALLRSLAPSPQLRLMVSGSASHCGKTTFTLLLLECLRKTGLKVGYLKPTTQCEAESIVTKYCKEKGVRTKVRCCARSERRHVCQAQP